MFLIEKQYTQVYPLTKVTKATLVTRHSIGFFWFECFEGLMRTSILASKSNRKCQKDLIAAITIRHIDALDLPSRASQKQCLWLAAVIELDW